MSRIKGGKNEVYFFPTKRAAPNNFNLKELTT